MALLKKQRVRAAILSIAVSLVVLFLKSMAYFVSGSEAIRSDVVETVVNVVAASFALFASLYAARPADANHPYGHGKMEFFSAIFESILITSAAAFIVFEAVLSFFKGYEVRDLGAGMWIVAVAGVINLVLGLYLLRVAKKTKSMALEADGQHLLSDVYTTVGIVVGLLLVKATGWLWLDPLMALLVGLVLGMTGFKMLKKSSGALMDEEDRELLDRLLVQINQWPLDDIVTLHRLRAMRAGHFAHVDVHLLVPEYLDVKEAHALVHRFTEKLSQMSGLDGEWHTHFEPCRRRYCSVCPVQDCPIRQKAFVARKTLTLEQAISPYESPVDPPTE